MRTGLAVITSAIIGGVLGGLITQSFNSQNLSNKELVSLFYEMENAVSISPHGYRKHSMEDKSVILVDVRSKGDFEKEHIKGSINIPADIDPEKIINEFKKLEGKTVITYCYSSACMSSKKVGKLLAENGVYVKHLNIGWNEWKYHRKQWNYPEERENIDITEYIESGESKNINEIKNTNEDDALGECKAEGGLGC